MSGNIFRKHALGVSVVAVLTVTPIILLLLLVTRRSIDSAELLRSAQLLTCAPVLGASVFAYFRWRMSAASGGAAASRLLGWLTVGLVAVALHGLVQAAMLGAQSNEGRNGWPMVGDIVLLVALIIVAVVAGRAEVPGDPAIIGAVGGLVITASSYLALIFAPPLATTPLTAHLLNTTVLLAGLLFALTVLQRSEISLWVSRRLALSAVLLTGAQCVTHEQFHNTWIVALAIVANVLGAVLLCTMTEGLLRRSVHVHQGELLELHETLVRLRADVLRERELLHEVGSTVAGITTAARMLRQELTLPPQRRQRLEDMLDAELTRLDRLMGSRAPAMSTHIDVDSVLAHLVTSHRERNLDVRSTPSNLRALGDADELAEVVNILLENARCHGGRTVDLGVTEVDGFVEITCSDDGPGIDQDFRQQLFASGVRGPSSPGQGLGLAIAQRLLSDRGGSLVLAESTAPGATFVARLPTEEMAHVAAHRA